MKKVTAEEFRNLVKNDKDLQESFKAALQKAEGRTASEVAGDLGYQIEMPEIQALDDDALDFVAGGARNNEDSNGIIYVTDATGFYPINFTDDIGLDFTSSVKR